MEAREVRTAEDARTLIEERDLTHVKVGVFDIDGILRGKYMSKKKFLSALSSGFGFCDVVLGWDADDQLYDNVSFTGWHTGYPDAPVRLLPESCRDLPFEETVLFLGEFAEAAEAVCPRAMLRRAIDKGRAMGFEAMAALEYEFFVFDETPHSIREKGYRDLKPIAPGTFGYSVLRNSVWSDFYEALLEMAEDMDFPIEGLHEETGPGVLEAAIAVDGALAAADKAALFKTFTKILAQRGDLMATFMAKWSPDWPGQSGHLHVSLQDTEGRSVFYEDGAEFGMSETMRHFVAGCQQLMPQLLCMLAPTVNSFSRLVPGAWAPTNATWGVENRTCALRVIPGSAKSQRLEYRVGSADANPHLALAAVLASGLYGIEHELDLEEPLNGNAYEQSIPPERSLPATLWDAAQAFKASDAARAIFGDTFVDHFASSREWEEREFRKAITDWELKRYFEII
ncbi:MAG: glutamine synthetase [Deltaproteobacteria bacterium]|nr:glutamine synthetase [Deltaproteobacteria bacterium]